jgi:hypothetical protein
MISWEVGALVAEIASAIGVIITLAYLAYQISQTNRIAKAAVVRELQQKYTDLYELIVSDPSVLELATKLREPTYRASLEEEEEKLDKFSLIVLGIWFSTQVSYNQGQIDLATYKIYLEDVEAKLSTWPALTPYLKRAAERFPSGKSMEIMKPIFA